MRTLAAIVLLAMPPAAAGPDIVFTQLRPGGETDRARIVRLAAGSGTPIVLTEGFHAALDPEISFDGRRMLFAGKRSPTDDWNVFETALDGSGTRQVTRDTGNCRSPVYLGTIYTIDDEAPSEQIAFVGDLAGELDEGGTETSTSLYSCRPDGSRIRRLTYNPSSDLDPAVLPDGRLVFSSRQRRNTDHGPHGRVSLFAAQSDGLDYAIFSGDEGRPFKRMPCVTAGREVVFVEGERLAPDGSGALARVSLRRNLHSYRSLAGERDGLFHSPSPLPGGEILVSRRPADGAGTHGIYRMDPATGRLEPIFDDPASDDVQARAVAPRPEPDGRSSVVSESRSTGTFYCLSVYESDLRDRDRIEPGTPLRLRVLEGIPRRVGGPATGEARTGRRVLGEIGVERDGSFNIEVPANVPIELQLLDGEGAALRSCGWIWVRQGENRGCIGCHESGEMAPPNRLARAVTRPAVPLTLPPSPRGER